jgi:hypothetical protein
MNDATLTWAAAASGVPTGYVVTWSINGSALPSVTVPQTAAQDTSGYSQDFISATGRTPAPGDTIGATVQAVDATGKYLPSAVVTSTPASVTVPAAPVQLGPPVNVVLALS